jgi:DNA repair protein RecN (Recombination protein N)
MLTLLNIRNLALVDELSWELGAGMIAVTGETGAGKSVIVGALKLVLGERADKGLIRNGTDRCMVEGVFELRDPGAVNAVLEEGGLDPCEGPELIVRRVISQKGNRQFVNDSPVTLAMLKRLGDLLVDLHGPHDHQSLLSTERQLAMLDAYAGADSALGRYREAWRAWRESAAEFESLRRAEEATEQEIELLRHQIGEIDAAELSPGDEGEIEDRWRRAANATRLVEAAGAATSVLGGEEGGVIERLAEVQRAVRDLERLDPTVCDRTAGLETAVVELQELESALAEYVADLSLDPAEFAALEERVGLIEGLKRKYGPGVADVLEHREQVAERLDAIENRGERLARLESEVKERRARLDDSGRSLGRLRRKAAPRLAREIAGQLRDLGFAKSTFEVKLERLSEPGARGLEGVEFRFGPNPGEPVLPLRQVASSGEVSRVMLAVKSALAEQDETPLMVFDEIDANVGGEIAAAVGRKMAVLGRRHQVVAITHFPQVAASGDGHFVVEKEVRGGRTRSRLFPVEGEGRVGELVRMLGGGGKSARAMAVSLLECSRQH